MTSQELTSQELLTRLSRLLPAQFEEVLFRAGIPDAHISGATAPRATRAIEAIRHVEQQHRLEQLTRTIKAVVDGGNGRRSDESSAWDPP